MSAKQLDRTREEREAEYSKYSDLAERARPPAGALQRSARSTERRLATLKKDESRLNGLLAALERTRRDEAARGLRGAVTATRRDHYRRPGQARLAGGGGHRLPVWPRHACPAAGSSAGTASGIAAASRARSVKAVETGKVRLVGQFGTYGLTVVLEHGNGYYSVYSHLESAGVKLGANVKKGDVIGTVGGQNSDYGPHLHFEIRGENQVALDPTQWLRKR